MLQILQSGAPGGPAFLVALLAVGTSAAVSYYIYRDATGRGSRHAVAWGLGGFFGGLVVWILYLVVRDEAGSGERG